MSPAHRVSAASGRNCSRLCPSPPRSCCSPWCPCWRLPTRAAVHRRVRPGVRDRPGHSGLVLSRARLLLDLPVHAVQHRGLVGRAGLCIASSPSGQGQQAAGAAQRLLSPRIAGAAVLVASWASSDHDQLAIRQNEAHNLWAYRRCRRTGSRSTTRRPPPSSRPMSAQETASSTSRDENHYLVDSAWPTTCAASCRRRSSGIYAGPGEQPAANECHDRRSASRARRDSGWSSSTTCTGPVLALNGRRRPPGDPRLPDAGDVQENGITVALLAIGCKQCGRNHYGWTRLPRFY